LYFAFPVLHFSFSTLIAETRIGGFQSNEKCKTGNAKCKITEAAPLSRIGIAGFAFYTGLRSGYDTDWNG
jgi:hypothetical protein